MCTIVIAYVNERRARVCVYNIICANGFFFYSRLGLFCDTRARRRRRCRPSAIKTCCYNITEVRGYRSNDSSYLQMIVLPVDLISIFFFFFFYNVEITAITTC